MVSANVVRLWVFDPGFLMLTFGLAIIVFSAYYGFRDIYKYPDKAFNDCADTSRAEIALICKIGLCAIGIILGSLMVCVSTNEYYSVIESADNRVTSHYLTENVLGVQMIFPGPTQVDDSIVFTEQLSADETREFTVDVDDVDFIPVHGNDRKVVHLQVIAIENTRQDECSKLWPSFNGLRDSTNATISHERYDVYLAEQEIADLTRDRSS